MKRYIARQEIVDINKQVIAYEIFFRDSKDGILHIPSDFDATMQVLFTILNYSSILEIAPNDVKIFLNCDHVFLLSGIPELLDSNKFVLELLETIEMNDAVEKKIIELKTNGYTIAIDDFNCTDTNYEKFKSILKYIDIVKICLLEVNVMKNNKECNICCQTLKENDIIVLAEKVENEIAFSTCKCHGFELFQGYYISKPEVFEFDSNIWSKHD